MKIVFDEFYGELSYSQRAAYRKYNVSPSDHDDLVRHFGGNDHAAITREVKRLSAERGMFSTFDLGRV